MFKFNDSVELKRIATEHDMKISEIAVAHEAELEEKSNHEIIEKMKISLEVMRENIKVGIDSSLPSIGGLIGTSAKAMHEYHKHNKTLSGKIQSKAIAYALQ